MSPSTSPDDPHGSRPPGPNPPDPVAAQDRSDLYGHVAGLLFRCPFDQARSCDCFLQGIRDLPMKERHQWLKGLSNDEVASICERHWICLEKKQNQAVGQALEKVAKGAASSQ